MVISPLEKDWVMRSSGHRMKQRGSSASSQPWPCKAFDFQISSQGACADHLHACRCLCGADYSSLSKPQRGMYAWKKLSGLDEVPEPRSSHSAQGQHQGYTHSFHGWLPQHGHVRNSHHEVLTLPMKCLRTSSGTHIQALSLGCSPNTSSSGTCHPRSTAFYVSGSTLRSPTAPLRPCTHLTLLRQLLLS